MLNLPLSSIVTLETWLLKPMLLKRKINEETELDDLYDTFQFWNFGRDFVAFLRKEPLFFYKIFSDINHFNVVGFLSYGILDDFPSGDPNGECEAVTSVSLQVWNYPRCIVAP